MKSSEISKVYVTPSRREEPRIEQQGHSLGHREMGFIVVGAE